MPHFYKRLIAMVLMCGLSIAAVRGLPVAFPASTLGELHYMQSNTPSVGTVMTIDGEAISAEEYAFYFLDYANAWNSMLASMGMSWSNVWTEEEFLEQVRSSVEQELTERRATIELVDRYNIHLTRDQIDEALDMKQQSIDSLGGYEGFLDQLQQIGMTEIMFNNRLYSTYAYQRVNEVLFGEGGEYRTPLEDLRAYMDENYLRAKHVLISKDTEGAEALAAEVAQRAQAGEDFDELVVMYGEDPGMMQQPDGYIFMEGEMVDEFYQGTKALEVGGISDPVSSDFGWHIIQRLPITDELLELNRDYICQLMEAYSIDDLLADYAAGMEVVKNEELYNAIDLYTVQDYLIAADGAEPATDGDGAEPADGAEPVEDAAAADDAEAAEPASDAE